MPPGKFWRQVFSTTQKILDIFVHFLTFLSNARLNSDNHICSIQLKVFLFARLFAPLIFEKSRDLLFSLRRLRDIEMSNLYSDFKVICTHILCHLLCGCTRTRSDPKYQCKVSDYFSFKFLKVLLLRFLVPRSSFQKNMFPFLDFRGSKCNISLKEAYHNASDYYRPQDTQGQINFKFFAPFFQFCFLLVYVIDLHSH